MKNRIKPWKNKTNKNKRTNKERNKQKNKNNKQLKTQK